MDSLITALSLHIAFLLVWSASLVTMPALFMRQARAADEESREQVRLMERWLYANLMTPAAVLAVLAGTWLVFERGFSGGWLHAKLALVLAMTGFHIYCGHTMVKLKHEGAAHRPWRYGALAAAPVTLVVAIVWLVTGKPF